MIGYKHGITTAEKLEFYTIRIPESTCWYWIGTLHPLGYGKISIGYGDVNRKTRLAHRIAYEEANGPIPEGMAIDHLCRERSCVNPAHLEPVTHKENTRRGLKGILRPATTHCIRGHAYTESNTQYSGKGHKRCVECRKTVHNETRKPKRRKRPADF